MVEIPGITVPNIRAVLCVQNKVLAEENTTKRGQFVTWKCSGGTDYYWGHYFSDQFAAEKDLITRAQEEIEILKERPVKQKFHKEKECER